MTEGMFDPLPSGRTATSLRLVSEWDVLQPVPQDAPAPPAKHPKLGVPSQGWHYRDAGGRLLGFVCRFDPPAAGKEIRSLVFAEHKKFGRQWRWLGFPKPRPLYQLEELAVRPEARVVVTEGEKAADAAGGLLPDYVATTCIGGSRAAKHADWSPLAGRHVMLWPDADNAGQAFARDVLNILAKLSPVPTAALVKPPENVAQGWDAADALADGWTPAKAAKFVAEASAAAYGGAADGGSRRQRPMRDGLIELLDECELWHDPERVSYATIPVNGHRENHEIASRGFKRWLAWRSYETAGVSPSGQVIEDAARIAEALAVNRGPCCPTWRRVAEQDGRFYLDLADAQCRAVTVTAAGWRIVDEVPVKFLRTRGMLPLPEPDPGERRIEDLREFVNVESDADFNLLVAWLVAALRPSGPYPVLVTNGRQGAAKSTLARICRLLIDPNASPIRSTPRDERDLLVTAWNSWLLIYDNLSAVPHWLSDAWCRLSTGGGFSTRMLHSDRDEMIFSAMRPIALNGIGDLATRADLADRALSITLPPLSEERRQPEREFWKSFEKARPRILGALLDGLAAGLRRLDEIQLARPPRMADFAQFVEAAAPGLGWEPGEFLRDYESNRVEAITTAAEASPLVPAIEAVLGRLGLGPEGFDGTAHELLGRLCEACSEGTQRARWFPRTDSQMGSALRRIAPLLEARGIAVAHYKAGRQKTRMIALRCASQQKFEELLARIRGATNPARGGEEPPSRSLPAADAEREDEIW